MADIFDVVSDPTRRDLLVALREGGELSVGQLVERLALSQPTVSKHLKVLRDHGVVAVREEGQHRYYHLDEAPFAQLVDWLAPFLSTVSADDDLTVDDGGSAVFAAWSGADLGESLGRRIADGQHQAIAVIQDASEAVQKRLPVVVRKRLFRHR